MVIALIAQIDTLGPAAGGGWAKILCLLWAGGGAAWVGRVCSLWLSHGKTHGSELVIRRRAEGTTLTPPPPLPKYWQGQLESGLALGSVGSQVELKFLWASQGPELGYMCPLVAEALTAMILFSLYTPQLKNY